MDGCHREFRNRKYKVGSCSDKDEESAQTSDYGIVKLGGLYGLVL